MFASSLMKLKMAVFKSNVLGQGRVHGQLSPS